MGTYNDRFVTTRQAAELFGDAGLYFAIAGDDGLRANTAEEALGIVLTGAFSGDYAQVGYMGELKYRAGGGSHAVGDKLTITTSGYFTVAGSADMVVGENTFAVASGGIGTGVFSFPQTRSISGASLVSKTTADAIGAGFAYAFVDNKLANNSSEFSGIVQAATSSGATALVAVFGVATARTGSGGLAAGQHFMAITSGYLVGVTSGYMANGFAVAAITSGSTGSVVVIPQYTQLA